MTILAKLYKLLKLFELFKLIKSVTVDRKDAVATVSEPEPSNPKGLNSMPEVKYKASDLLSPHFPISDMIRSGLATRYGVDQLVHLNPEIIEAAKLLADNVAEKLRVQFGPFSPNSWFRSPPIERILCAKSYTKWCADRKRKEEESSWEDYLARKSHPKGGAMDVEFAGVSNLELFEWCKENLDYDQLILEFHDPEIPSSGWVHVSYAPINRKQAFSIG
jgi:zinc D-Ala-D-Ala carboxypeptidase